MSRKKDISDVWPHDPIWPEFVEVESSPVYKNSSNPWQRAARTFLNERYEVTSYEMPGGITWLTIKRRKKEHVHDWRELQEIKNQICGRDREGFELYPGEWRCVDTANQYQLFVLPLGMGLAVGYTYRDVSADVPDEYEWGKGRQRPLPGWMTPNHEPPSDQEGQPIQTTGPVAHSTDEDGNLRLLIDLLEVKDDDG